MRGLIRGAAWGLGLASIFLLILGALPLYRLVVHHTGAPFSPDNVRTIEFFILGCMAAGGVIGLAWGALRSKTARGTACAVGGIIAMLLIGEGPRGGLPPMSAGDIAFYALIGALFGLVFSGTIPWGTRWPAPAREPPSVLDPQSIDEIMNVARHQSPERLREFTDTIRATGVELPAELVALINRQGRPPS